MEEVVKEVPDPRSVPPVEAEYQLMVPAEEKKARERALALARQRKYRARVRAAPLLGSSHGGFDDDEARHDTSGI